jgi:hypothetical protein
MVFNVLRKELARLCLAGGHRVTTGRAKAPVSAQMGKPKRQGGSLSDVHALIMLHFSMNANTHA